MLHNRRPYRPAVWQGKGRARRGTTLLIAAVLAAAFFAASWLPAQDKPAKPVAWKDLGALLVDRDGYVASVVLGENNSAGRDVDGYAYRFYKKEGVAFTVGILDCLGSTGAFEAAEKHFTNASGTEFRNVVFEGLPAVECVVRETRSVTILLRFADRFLIILNGIPIEGHGPLRDLFAGLDRKKLAALGK